MDSSTFRSRFPEFRACTNELVTAALAEAETRTDRAELGDKADVAKGYLAAHILWCAPFGHSLRTEGDKPSEEGSRYFKAWSRVIKKRVGGPMVA